MSAVRIILLESPLSSASAFFSSLVILFVGTLIFLRMALISPLNSSALPGINFVQTFSIEAMYSPTGEFLGRMAKLGPLDNIFFCASVKGYWISYVPISSHDLLPYLGFCSYLVLCGLSYCWNCWNCWNKCPSYNVQLCQRLDSFSFETHFELGSSGEATDIWRD